VTHVRTSVAALLRDDKLSHVCRYRENIADSMSELFHCKSAEY